MKIGRFTSEETGAFWAVVSDDGQSATEIPGALEDWAPSAARGSAPPSGATHRVADLTLLAPLDPAGRIFGCGMNYPTHLDDSGTQLPVPEHMIGFLRIPETLIAPDAVMRQPPTEQFDYEIEIVAVLAGPLPADGDATAALLGYTVANDTSVRDAPRPGGMVDLFTMKAQEGTTPVGPHVATLDDFGGPGQPSIDFELRINGEMRQRDNTTSMLWSVDRLLRSLDARVRLRAGDLVFTGTPGGTGMRSGRFMHEGDVVEIEAEGIGLLRNTVGPLET